MTIVEESHSPRNTLSLELGGDSTFSMVSLKYRGLSSPDWERVFAQPNGFPYRCEHSFRVCVARKPLTW